MHQLISPFILSLGISTLYTVVTLLVRKAHIAHLIDEATDQQHLLVDRSGYVYRRVMRELEFRKNPIARPIGYALWVGTGLIGIIQLVTTM